MQNKEKAYLDENLFVCTWKIVKMIFDIYKTFESKIFPRIWSPV
jgi:hypothetical protein